MQNHSNRDDDIVTLVIICVSNFVGLVSAIFIPWFCCCRKAKKTEKNRELS